MRRKRVAAVTRSTHSGRATGAAVVRDADRGVLTIIRADAALEKAAWEIFRTYSDQAFSFVDCVSFAWLRDHAEAEVFAFDRHFTWMGFPPFQG